MSPFLPQTFKVFIWLSMRFRLLSGVCASNGVKCRVLPRSNAFGAVANVCLCRGRGPIRQPRRLTLGATKGARLVASVPDRVGSEQVMTGAEGGRVLGQTIRGRISLTHPTMIKERPHSSPTISSTHWGWMLPGPCGDRDHWRAEEGVGWLVGTRTSGAAL